ncbi:unknown [Acidaminococcus sp. CAG:917]|nr:unknown [Acidaminococcus sp. CAG:917]
MGVEYRLKQDVAYFLEHHILVFCVDGLDKLVCFLDKIDSYRFVSLRLIPFASVLCPKPCHNLDKIGKIVALAVLNLCALYVNNAIVAVKVGKVDLSFFLAVNLDGHVAESL